MWLELLVVAAAAAAAWLLRHFTRTNSHWARRGIDGPAPELFFGNIRELWHFNRPKSLVLKQWTERYGKMYGIYEGQVPTLVISDFALLNEIIVKQFDHFGARPRFPLQRKHEAEHSNIVRARGAQWKRLRALGAAAFTPKSLRKIFATVAHSADLLMAGIDQHEGEINMLECFQEYTLDVVCKVALGLHDVRIFHNDLIKFCRAFFYLPLRSPIACFTSLFPCLQDAFISVVEGLGSLGCWFPMRSPMMDVYEVIGKKVEERRLLREKTGYKSSSDFIDIFLDAEVDASLLDFGEVAQVSRKLATPELVGQCAIFLLAGFDTTSNSLAYVAYFLANHMDVQARLQDEIDEYLRENATLEVDKLGSLTYMAAVLKESLRHYPLANLVVARECTKACEINGIQFEVGDRITTDTWSLHMDKSLWGEDACEFRPERWLEASDRPRAAFQSFGEGPRMCLGMRLAYIEEKTILIKLLAKYTIEPTENTNTMRPVGSVTVSPDRVMVRLVRR